jgi:hypothetical protein
MSIKNRSLAFFIFFLIATDPKPSAFAQTQLSMKSAGLNGITCPI